ncbi:MULTISPECIES: OmpH family outer membrane protein [unclassified Hahella]|uniref:OmpH family outer membrane protein n=1 Tax=unclassified Hahella TaxID=2624107 RepID=UPI000FDEA66C|nr:MULTISPECIES: OmpH family outer membrane protein [unclassified Hahella]AZZ90923.1 OmpH family outer membrane protein [Hahella sp. KA22]MBU6949926.1 OmpH family outer membrane protein [Hahella sp. HN01]MDG9668280.1 OmpH family outer membrane protein [Hahella sp. CR1]QAY54293.1 OmpH family outer membrane protein [Hahella sp. KA22]
MKLIRIAALALALVSTGYAGMVSAAQKVAVVDLRTALLSSQAAKKFGENLKKDFADEEARLREVGEQAQKMQERLKKDSAIMSETERTKLNAELEEKAQEFNFLKNKYQSAISKREELFLQESKPKVDDALKKIAEKEKVDVILPSKLAVYANPSLDLTAKLIEALNSAK